MPQVFLLNLPAAARRPELPTSSAPRSRKPGERLLGGLVLALSCAATLAVSLAAPLAAQTSTDWMQARVLGGRSGHAMAYDVARQRVVVFGGSQDDPYDPSGDTWEWDGNVWTQRTPATSPSARTGHSMVYDVARQRVVLFGGFSGLGYLADTWEWDGANWTQLTPATTPAGRAGHAMAYDVARQRVVLFGGVTVFGPVVRISHFGDTWEWDGSNWTQRTPATSPSPDHARPGARRRFSALPGRSQGLLGRSAACS